MEEGDDTWKLGSIIQRPSHILMREVGTKMRNFSIIQKVLKKSIAVILINKFFTQCITILPLEENPAELVVNSFPVSFHFFSPVGLAFL
jgi:hypothetical protein